MHKYNKRMIKVGMLSKYTFGHSGAVAFAPHKGVLVKTSGANGIIATISATQYLELVRDSLEELATKSAGFFASKVSTSARYAEIAIQKLVDTLRWQEELLGSSREIVIGVVANKNDEVYAIGKKSVTRKKISVLARIRSMLPVGTMNLYKVDYTSVVYKVPYLPETDADRTSSSVGELMGKEETPRNYVIIMDSSHYRAYAGRTLLTSKDRWNTWRSEYGVPNDTTVFLCNDSSWREFSAEELCEMNHNDLYLDSPDVPHLGPVMKIIETLANRAENSTGFIVTVYMTDYAAGSFYFADSMKSFINTCGQAMVVFKRFGRGGRETLLRTRWRVGTHQKITYDEVNYKLSDLMMSLKNEWPIVASGIGVGNVEVYKAIQDSTIEQIAQEAGFPPRQFLVDATQVVGHDILPIYLYTIKGVAILTTSKLSGVGPLASAPASTSQEFNAGTKFYRLSGELSSLLAN